MSEHARLSPSNDRWPYCSGSVREEAKYHDVSGDAAIDGTGSHLLLELCVPDNVPASDYNGKIIGVGDEDKPQGWIVDTERCKRVQICLDYVTRRKEELQKQFPGCEITVESESKSNPGFYVKRSDWWGTCDITITVTLNDVLVFVETVDYKDGRGYVSEKWNNQLIAYLFGKIIKKNNGNIVIPDIGMRMTIVQPKTGTPIRYLCSTNPDHGLNKESLMSKIDWLTAAADATDDPNAPLVPGKHCMWCKHNPKRGGTCTALIEESIGGIETMTTDIAVFNKDSGLLDLMVKAVSDIKSISPADLAKIADIKPGFFAVFDNVEKEIQEKIESGVEVPGYAMVPGNASKKWNEDEEVIVKKLKAKKLKKDQIYPSKLITPAAALSHPDLTDVQKKKIKEELISEIAGKDTLKKVAYDHKAMKDTGKMFDGVGEKKETISFF